MTNTFVFVSESLQKHGNFTERTGLRGTRAHVADDSRVGSYRCGGQIVLEPTPADVNFWLPYILGGSSGSWSLQETLPSLTIGVQRGEVPFLYSGCVVNRAAFAGSQTGALRLTLDIVAQNETVGTAITFSTESVTPMYMFSDMVLTIDSLAWPVQSFDLSFDNGLLTDRFLNSLTIVSANATDRNIALRTVHPWNAIINTDLYDAAQSGTVPLGFGSSGSGGTLVLTNAAASSTAVLTFTFGNLQSAANPATAAQRTENFMTMPWTVRKTGTTAEVVVTSTT